MRTTCLWVTWRASSSSRLNCRSMRRRGVGVAGDVAANHLQRDRDAQLRVPRVVDGAHAADAEQPDDVVAAAERLARREHLESGASRRWSSGRAVADGAVDPAPTDVPRDVDVELMGWRFRPPRCRHPWRRRHASTRCGVQRRRRRLDGAMAGRRPLASRGAPQPTHAQRRPGRVGAAVRTGHTAFARNPDPTSIWRRSNYREFRASTEELRRGTGTRRFPC